MTEKGIYNREHGKRLKERFRNGAIEDFHNNEILELVLAFAAPRRDIRKTARVLIKRFKGLRGVFDASIDELRSVEGMTENAAVFIKLLKDTSGAYLRERMMGTDVIRAPKDALDYLNLTLSGERVEKFLAIYLNSRNEVLSIDLLHEGTINQTVVYPRKVIEKAFKHNAHSLIFVHNHPSGDATPSNVDRQLTAVLCRAAHAVDLIVHDHLIIGRNNYFSARESGWFMGGPGGARMSVIS